MDLFFSPDPLRPGERRLRAAWRIAGQLVMLALFGCFILVPLLALQAAGAGRGPNLFLAQQVVGLVAISVSVFLARRLLDRRSIRSLGLETRRGALWDLPAGILIAGLMMAAIFLIEWLAGWVQIESTAWSASAGPSRSTVTTVLVLLVVFIAVGWQEELYARGYLLRNLIDGLKLPAAVLISSAIFALAHLGNPNVNALAIPGLLLAGLFFAWAALRSGGLWLPIGLHIGWNFFEGAVFGFPVSGLDLSALLRLSSTGPELLTGGTFGPEAGLVLLPGLALGFALVGLWTRRRSGV